MKTTPFRTVYVRSPSRPAGSGVIETRCARTLRHFVDKQNLTSPPLSLPLTPQPLPDDVTCCHLEGGLCAIESRTQFRVLLILVCVLWMYVLVRGYAVEVQTAKRTYIRAQGRETLEIFSQLA